MKYLAYSLAIAIVMCSCSYQRVESTQIEEVKVDSIQGMSPYFTSDAHGIAVISWVRMSEDSSFQFCFAKTSDGKKFSNTIAVPYTSNVQPHGENLPKIIFKPSGEIMAIWGIANPNPANKYSGLIFYSQSFDDGQTWKNPVPLVQDSSAYDQRYFDVTLLPDGEVGIIWLDNRKSIEGDGSAVFFASTKGNEGFQKPRKISEPACPCCRTGILVDEKKNIHVIYRGIQQTVRDMVHIVSSDGGQTFSEAKKISDDNWVINGCPHTGPAMAENSNGLHFAWYTGGTDAGSYYSCSKDGGSSFRGRNAITSVGSHPQICVLGNENLLLAWDEAKVENGSARKMIGLQSRDANGTVIEEMSLHSMADETAFPVVTPIGKSGAMIAYTGTFEKKKYVMMQVVGK